MRIISIIEDREIIKAIMKHLGLWLVKSRPIPKAHAPPPIEYVMEEFSQLPMNDDFINPQGTLNMHIFGNRQRYLPYFCGIINLT